MLNMVGRGKYKYRKLKGTDQLPEGKKELFRKNVSNCVICSGVIVSKKVFKIIPNIKTSLTSPKKNHSPPPSSPKKTTLRMKKCRKSLNTETKFYFNNNKTNCGKKN